MVKARCCSQIHVDEGTHVKHLYECAHGLLFTSVLAVGRFPITQPQVVSQTRDHPRIPFNWLLIKSEGSCNKDPPSLELQVKRGHTA